MSRSLITGATAGIGYTFARTLAARGHDLVLVARDVERLRATADELVEKHGIDAEVLPADLTVREELKRVEDRLTDTERRVDLLINNAGFGLKRRFLDNTVEDEQAGLDILVIAVMRLSHAALSAMTARGEGGIINVSSVAGYLPRGTYAAAKAWVNAFTGWAAGEYAKDGVHVMLLCPGFTKTEFHERMGVTRKSAPRFLWLDVNRLVDEALADYDHGRTRSIPSKRYKAIVAISRVIPTSVLQRGQTLGRK